MSTAEDDNQDAQDRVGALRVALADFGQRFCDLVRELSPIASAIAELESELRAAEHQAGRPWRRSSARELAADILHGELAALRPYIPHVSAASAALSAEALCDPRYPRGRDLEKEGKTP